MHVKLKLFYTNKVKKNAIHFFSISQANGLHTCWRLSFGNMVLAYEDLDPRVCLKLRVHLIIHYVKCIGYDFACYLSKYIQKRPKIYREQFAKIKIKVDKFHLKNILINGAKSIAILINQSFYMVSIQKQWGYSSRESHEFRTQSNT